MKNKKLLIIGIPITFVLIIATIVCLILMNQKSKVITIDINPSIELTITKGKVKAKALSEDGNEFTREEWQNKELDEYLDRMVERAIDLHLTEEENITIILGMNKKEKEIENKIREAFERKDIHPNIIIPEITKEAQKEAKKHGITPAKAAYILEVVEENKKLHIEDLIEVSANDLNRMKESDLYCEEGFILRGDFCEKKVREENPQEGKVCPINYEEVNGQCYRSGLINEELYCLNGLQLENDKCVGEVVTDAKIKCTTGEYNVSTNQCESYTYSSEGTKYCGGDGGKISQKGTCTYPKPLINGGCPSPDVVIDGWCYNMIDGGSDYPNVTCPAGTVSYNQACYTKTSTNPTYYCEGKDKLKDNKCVSTEPRGAERKIICEAGFTSYEDRFCINYNDTKEYENGLVCDREAHLEENKCIFYEQIEPKQK